MNKTNISKEKIIDICLANLEKEENFDLNIRKIAKLCNVSVGTIYNYFPNKTYIAISIVDRIWRDIFSSVFEDSDKEDYFKEMIISLCTNMNLSISKYNNFALLHKDIIGNNDIGKEKMQKFLKIIQKNLLLSLEKDKRIDSNIWNQNFSKNKLINFILNYLMSYLIIESNNLDFLITMIEKMLY